MCGGASWSEHRRATRLRTCPGCGSIWNDRSDSRQAEEAQYDHCASVVVQDEDPVARAQWDWVSGLLDRINSGLPSVLDIGCGKGAFLSAAAAGGAKVHGLELDPAVAEVCSRRGLPVTQGSLFDVGVPAGPWDAITLWDVLDHLEDPSGALQLIVRELAPGGILVVRGRNTRIHAPLKAIYSRHRGSLMRLGWVDLSVVHRWGWSPAGWRRLLGNAGLSDTRLYAGLPTPGDRYGTLGPRLLTAVAKGVVQSLGSGLFRASAGRLYPFPSVLASGRRPR